MSQTQTCTTCGKAVKTGKSGSLTQWLLTVDACECNAPSLKLEIDEAVEAPTLCELCGKLRSDSRQGSLTQWVFGQDRCKCNLEEMYKGVDDELKAAYSSSGKSRVSPKIVEPKEDEDFIDQLESDDFDTHGLASDRFPFLRFRIIETIGKGNVGIVYECWDMTLRKRVAIKTISSQHYSSEELMRLQTEAKASSKLNHPNVLKVLDFAATTGGQPYMVMELLRGRDLARELADKGPIEPRRAVEIFLQICAAVKHAHESGILHRDIKPSNIMLSRVRTLQGEVEIAKVIDFGIAAFNRNNTFKAEALDEITLAGSPLYMSPDQVNGLIFDERSDIYSIGCVMFESLSGKPPFKGATAMETMKMHASCELPELSDTIPEPLVKAVRTALAKSPDDRFQNLDQLIDALKVEMQFEPQVVVAPEVVAEPEAKDSWTNSRPILIGVPLALIMLVAAATMLAPRFMAKKHVNPAQLRQQPWDPRKGEKNDVDRSVKVAVDDTRVQVEENDIDNGTKELSFTGSTRETPVGKFLEKCLKKKKVSSIIIVRCKFTERDFDILSQYTDLREISFDGTAVDENHLSKLSKCEDLTGVTFARCGITDDGLKQLGLLPQLFSITIDRNPGISARGFSYLCSNSITYLSLVACGPFDNDFLDQLSKFSKLRNLYIGENGLTNEQLERLPNFKFLQILGLNASKVDDKCIDKLMKFEDLQHLYAMRCPGITPRGFDRLKAASKADLLITSEACGFMGTDVNKFLGGDGNSGIGDGFMLDPR